MYYVQCTILCELARLGPGTVSGPINYAMTKLLCRDSPKSLCCCVVEEIGLLFVCMRGEDIVLRTFLMLLLLVLMVASCNITSYLSDCWP